MKIELELLEIIEQQKDLLLKKDKFIAELVNKNAEMEELINELIKEG